MFRTRRRRPDMRRNFERRKKSRSLWKKLVLLVTLIAIIKELQTPKWKRDWHGTLAGFIPYDFRIPSFQRIKDIYWNPKGPIIADRVWGAGWTVNLGRIKKLFTS
jgi:hypothetical protein